MPSIGGHAGLDFENTLNSYIPIKKKLWALRNQFEYYLSLCISRIQVYPTGVCLSMKC